MTCTKCQGMIEKGQKYFRTKKGPHHYECPINSQPKNELLEVVKLAYRKHHMMDDSVGWDELSNALLIALCNHLGSNGFCDWLKSLDNKD